MKAFALRKRGDSLRELLTGKSVTSDFTVAQIISSPGSKEKLGQRRSYIAKCSRNDVGYQRRLNVHFVKVVPTLHPYVGLNVRIQGRSDLLT